MKRIFKYLKKTIFGIIFIFVAYILFSVILALLPVNRDFVESEDSTLELWIKSNGVHLDLILPIKNKYLNWDSVLTVPENIKEHVKYVGFGWGDKEFYTTTPEWSDLKFSTAFNALFLRTKGALHVTYYSSLFENDQSIKIKISKKQFTTIQSFIYQSFVLKDHTAVLIEEITYGRYDRFYDANYAYTLFYTCNTWTNEALKKADLPACVWTPFDKGILYQYRNYINKK